MRTYAEAAALADAGAKQPCSTASGRTRWLTWAWNAGRPEASIYGNTVVTFAESYVHTEGRAHIDTHGYPTPSTFDAIAAALDIGRGHTECGTVKRVPHLLGTPFTRYATVDLASGKVIDHDEPSQATPPRPAKVW